MLCVFLPINPPTITAEPSAAGVALDEVRGVDLEPRGVLVCCLADPHADKDLALPDCCCADLLTSSNRAIDISTKHMRIISSHNL